MICKRILELLPKFIENDFRDEEYSGIMEHLEGCERCRKEYEAMKRLVDRLDAMPIVSAPPSFKDAVMRHLKEDKKEGK